MAGALAALVYHLRGGGPRTILVSATLLGLACGFRYEGWMFAIPYTGLLIFRAVTVQGRSGDRTVVLAAAALPWVIPDLWIWGSWVATNDPLQFLHTIRSYKLAWYGGERSYAMYPRAWWRLDPWATMLIPLGCMVSMLRTRRDPPIAVIGWLYVISTLVFVALHRGQVESTNNSVRYTGPFLFVGYPFALIAIDALWRRFQPTSSSLRQLAFGAIALGALAGQVRGAFAFIPDGNAAGLAVGRAIRDLRAIDHVTPPRTAMIELAYWSYLAVHVGADDVDSIVYDREIDLAQRRSSSLIRVNWPALRACISQWDVGYIAARTPELRAILERHFGSATAVKVGDWEIFRMAPNVGPSDAGVPCPLQGAK